MAISFMHEPATSALTSIDRQAQIAIETPSIWGESSQRPSGKKRRTYTNNLAVSASTISEAVYSSPVVDSYITYTESIDATLNETDRFLTKFPKFPELNPAAVRLQKLSYKIDSSTLHATFKLLSKLFEISRKNSLWWNLPLINVGFESEVVLEWWNKDRKLDFDILGSNIDYIKVWGADIDNEMEDGSIAINESELISLWKWITN